MNNAIVVLHQATCLGCTSLSTLESHFVNRTYTSAFSHSYYSLLLSPPNLSSRLAGCRSHQLRTHLGVHLCVHLSHLTHVHAIRMLAQHTYSFLLHSIVLCSLVSFLSPFLTIARGSVIFFGCLSLLTLHPQLVPPNIAASASRWLWSHCAGISFLPSLQLLIPVSSISFPPACSGVRCSTLGHQFVTA